MAFGGVVWSEPWSLRRAKRVGLYISLCTTAMTNPEGVTFGSRGRQPTGSPKIHVKPRRGDISVSISVHRLSGTTDRLNKAATGCGECHPVGVVTALVRRLTVGLHPRLSSGTPSGFGGREILDFVELRVA